LPQPGFVIVFETVCCLFISRNTCLLQGVSIELDEEMTDNEEQRELLQELISNSKLNEGYLTLARDLDVMEPKTPDDLYKVRILLTSVLYWFT